MLRSGLRIHTYLHAMLSYAAEVENNDNSDRTVYLRQQRNDRLAGACEDSFVG